MARERMVTRTVEQTTATTLCMDVLNASVVINEYVVSGKFENNDAILVALKKVYETDTLKVVAIQTVETKEVLYGMPEVDFIKYATVLPSRAKAE